MGAEVKFDAARGVWYAQPYLGTAPDGRQVRPRRSFPDARTKEQAQEMANVWQASLTAEGRVKSALVVDMLWDYIAQREAKGVSVNTVKRWTLFTRAYVARYLKGKAARELTTVDLNAFELRLLAPKDRGGQGLCRNTVSSVHHFLRGAYCYWMSVGLVDSNPMLSVRKPREDKHEAVALDEWDFKALNAKISAGLAPCTTDAAAMRRAAMAFAAWLALHTGMRLGEVCAMRRRDVMRRGSYLHVCGTVVELPGGGVMRSDSTKGRKSRNVSVAPEELAAVEEYIRLQDSICGPLKPDAALVSVDGSFMRPGTVSRAFSRIRDALGLPKTVTFHSLRHTHATWCLSEGVDLKTLSARLGHADEVITLRCYAHLLPGSDKAAASAFSGFVRELDAPEETENATKTGV